MLTPQIPQSPFTMNLYFSSLLFQRQSSLELTHLFLTLQPIPHAYLPHKATPHTRNTYTMSQRKKHPLRCLCDKDASVTRYPNKALTCLCLFSCRLLSRSALHHHERTSSTTSQSPHPCVTYAIHHSNTESNIARAPSYTHIPKR
jgi:hypothetical protein